VCTAKPTYDAPVLGATLCRCRPEVNHGTSRQNALEPVAVGSRWILLDATCYHCGDTLLIQNTADAMND
jgi:hypothetical protein